jgi:hypothetical protein
MRASMIGSILIAVVLAGSGDIHRCRSADGSVAFQDRPCEAATLPARPRAAPQRNALAPPQPAQLHATTPRQPANERLLATCSERFLHCASDNATRMDACIAAIAPCSGSRGAACCPSACVERYQSLRQNGEARASAVRLALLDPHAPSCTAGARH